MHVQNFSRNDIIKDILKKKNDVHRISDGTIVQGHVVYVYCIYTVYVQKKSDD